MSALPRPSLRALALAALAALAAGCDPPGAEVAPAPACALSFQRRGVEVARLSCADLEAKVAAQRVRVHDPYEDRELVFDGLPLAALLDAVYGPEWRAEGELNFTCRDEYRPSVAVGRFLEHQAFLALRRADAPAFSIDKPESGALRAVDLTPAYVVWENLEDAEIRSQGDYGWPYQVVAIDLGDFSERFPRMTPPADAAADVMRGFQAFRVHCMPCHAINGDGGQLGPELNFPVSVTEYFAEPWLHRWIDDPASVRRSPRMPRPALPEGERAAIIDDITAYLRAMARRKQAP
ncbi:MAG: cytochrome c [Myxococcales bacterium]|nr:cytochrome c [Myxococcales bacterium]